jgi:putative oxidoreductase
MDHQATASGFEQLGIRSGLPAALLAGTAEILGGFSLGAGLLTPVGAILVGAVMTTAILTAHARNGIERRQRLGPTPTPGPAATLVARGL